MGALVEPMSVAYHAATLAGVDDQSRALIYGAGPIGIGIWFALRGMGLTEIDVVEPSATRRESIEALGARTLDPSSDDVDAIIAERTGADGVDAAFDAAGVEPAARAGPA
jgi:(R,R)-butanediol dehydrogenase/meso-butanediol dehydrogenase/diacetyl reductase